MKIAVYTICKNEEQNIKDWYNSMSEADDIYVLDTGSTDKSIELLKECPKINVNQHIFEPFRFDYARNMSLDMVPKDIDLCICTDLDERFPKGWRKILEENYEEGITQYSYDYIYNFNEDGTPGLTYVLNKIHVREGFKWEHQVHETLKYDKQGKIKKLPLTLVQYQDKNKDRGLYFDILKRTIEAGEINSRDLYCLGREYKIRCMNKECIETFHKYLKLETSNWKEERSVVMRYMGYSYSNLQYNEEALMWYMKSIEETPNIREPYYDLGVFFYKIKKYKESVYYLNKALKIKQRNENYMNESYAWNGSIYDYLSIGEYYIGHINKAYNYAIRAHNSFKNDKRIIKNIELFKNKLNESKNSSTML